MPPPDMMMTQPQLRHQPQVTLLYYTILYYTILYYSILYYTILCYTLLYSTLLHYTMLYSTLLYYTILYDTIRYYAILYMLILHTISILYMLLSPYYTILYYTIQVNSFINAFQHGPHIPAPVIPPQGVSYVYIVGEMLSLQWSYRFYILIITVLISSYI